MVLFSPQISHSDRQGSGHKTKGPPSQIVQVDQAARSSRSPDGSKLLPWRAPECSMGPWMLQKGFCTRPQIRAWTPSHLKGSLDFKAWHRQLWDRITSNLKNLSRVEQGCNIKCGESEALRLLSCTFGNQVVFYIDARLRFKSHLINWTLCRHIGKNGKNQ